MTKASPFRYFKTSSEIIRLAVMMYVRFPLSLRNVEDLLYERSIEVINETVRYWWNRFGQVVASEIRRKRVQQLRAYSKWMWHVIGTIAETVQSLDRSGSAMGPTWSALVR